jgi:peptidoglycan/LPS O-acetylase OafA/YrhL
MPLTTPSQAYRTDIDGLRAIAVLLVLVFHFSLVPVVTAGFTGVDVFFVISGFLITGNLQRQIERGEFRVADFYLGRIRRLAPALVTTLAATFAVGLWVLFPNDLRELGNQLLAAQACVANVYFWRTVNYFGLNGENVFLLHTWSLAVEEQFYLLYPAALLVLWRWRSRWVWHGVAALLVMSFLLNVGLVRQKPEAVFYLLPTRAWELLAGGVTVFLASRVQTSRDTRQWLGAAGLLAIAAGATLYKPDWRFPGAFALVPVLGAALVLFSHDPRPTLSARVLQWAPLRYVGRISYPLYLVHWPIHVFAARLLGARYDDAARGAMFLVSFVAAALVFHGIETPIRERRWLAGRRSLLAGYGAALGITVAALAAVVSTGGLPQRFPPEVDRLASFVNDKTPPLAECEFDGRPGDAALAHPCRVGDATRSPRWLVVGDSHAWATRDAFDLWLKGRSESGMFVFRHGCPPLADVHLFGDDGTCFRFNRAVADMALRTPGIDAVALVSTWRQGRERLIAASEREQPTDARSRQLFAQGFAAEISRLKTAGKRVYVWEPLPGAKANVPISMARAALSGTRPDIQKTSREYFEEYDFFFSDLKSAGASVDGVFSPAAALCASGSCATSVDGAPLYFDNSHPTRSSASYFAEVLKHSGVPVSAPWTDVAARR